MKKRKIIFLNGRFVSQKEARIYVNEPGLLYGWGVFETLRSYNGNILYLSAHLKRLSASARLIGIAPPFSVKKTGILIKKVIKMNRLDNKDTYVRLSLWKGNQRDGICILVKPYQPHSLKKYRRGMQACISDFRQNENSLLAQIKSMNYLFFNLAYAQAKKQGFDEAVILNNRGYLTECSRANIFWVRNNRLYTPSLDCGCLNGVTRQIILGLAEKLKTEVLEGRFKIKALSDAQEAFITNSLIGIMPLVSVGKKNINKGIVGKMSKLFMQKYNSLLNNGI